MFIEISINALISSILQLFLFSLIPIVWWLIFWRKKEKFLPWLGIKKPVIKNKPLIISLCCLFVAVSVISNIFFEVVEQSETGQGQFQGMGSAALLACIFYGLIQTGLAEEAFFRGFLAKRLINRIGFMFGNIIQALMFGVMHVALFGLVISIDIYQGLLLFALPFLTALFFGYVNEKKSDGSIIPSWLMHGIGNVLAALIAMFNLAI